MSCFSFYLFSFLFCKIREQEVEQVLSGGRVGTSGRGEMMDKVGRRVNTVQKMCTHASNHFCNVKILVETVL
jgi:predicted methyltransferase MtxX (methanogen marker protein 4)